MYVCPQCEDPVCKHCYNAISGICDFCTEANNEEWDELNELARQQEEVEDSYE